MKRFIALARVSSREQEREGFSLAVQEDAFKGYARKHQGELVRLFRIAETATKSEERKEFRKLIAYAKKHHRELDGILFYKVDRAARNLKDFMLLEEIESDYGIEFISITQSTENTPSGRMMRRQLATFAAFTTEQQSLDVREGIRKRVEEGYPPSRASFGYRNVRIDGRSVVEVHPENSLKIRRIFELYAYHCISVEDLPNRLFQEGIYYSPSKPRFSVSSLYGYFRDRSYIGEVKYHGDWYPGNHKPLIDPETWNRVQVLLGQKVYRSHEMLYAGGLITCGHCGRPVTGEVKEKKTKKGMRRYTYYRCARYTKKNHPRIRIREERFEEQVLGLLAEMAANSEPVKSWLVTVFRERSRDADHATAHRITELKRQRSRLAEEQNELLGLRLSSKIDDGQFERKQAELREREECLTQQIEMLTNDRKKAEDVAQRAADVFQLILEKWPTADFIVKRRILEIVFSNFTLVGDQLVPGNRTPFELLAAG
jgi:DNA invertase Pin-like site-specific DNA recombinase